MLRHLTQRHFIRRYHESTSAYTKKQRLPVVKFANTQVQRSNDLRKHHEAPARVSPKDPHQRFEPFPYKVTQDNKAECLKRKVMPLFDVPYDEQLSSKESFCRNVLRYLGQELYRSGTPVRLDVKRLPCHISKMVGSPLLNKYRNKDEFSIWRGLDGKTITAGHMLFPISRHGDTICVEPNECEVIKNETIQVTNLFNDFLRGPAKLPVSYSLGTDGGWRRLMVRVNIEGDLMVVGVINPRALRVREVLDERDNFKEFMVRRCQETGLKLASLYYQPCPHNSCRHHEVPFELLHGSETITEAIGDFKIRISPETFLHNSSIGAEVLYEAVRSTMKECFLQENVQDEGRLPIIVDAFAGAGVLSLNLADLAQQVIGIDSSPLSVDDATANATLNGVSNVEFVNSNVEIVLQRILDKYAKQRREMIVVCDCPNTGLHPNTVDVLRNNRDIRKILMILNLNSKIERSKVMDNLISLCSKGGRKLLPPFAPILATPVDTCPHIESFQMVLALERSPF